MINNYFETSIEYVKGIGPQRADLLKKELKIFNIADLIQHYPFRHEDRSQFHKIADLKADMPYIQVKGKVKFTETIGEGSKQRFIAYLRDDTGDLELVWFKGIAGIKKFIQINQEYIVFGKPNEFNGKITLPHPEIQLYNPQEIKEQGTLFPVYHTTEKMKQKGLDSKALAKIIKGVLPEAIRHVRETLPEEVLQEHNLISKKEALANIHFPKSIELLQKAEYRLKFEELFYTQIRLIRQNLYRKETYQGFIFKDTSLLTEFYKNHLEFDLTNAQKRVIREIYKDVTSGKQMNRLLQGDVGSGKTIVAFIAMLLAVGNGFQACLMAPTEILAEQHYQGLKVYADKLNIPID
ncbi:MAG: DEAD/DEAH box helicase, partial [Raineya sp.]|nr:DEAD/DEAH box helicase [Raineya sp.]